MFAWIVDPSKDQKVELISQLLDQLGYVVRPLRSLAAFKEAKELTAPGNNIVVIPDTAESIVGFPEVVQLAGQLRGGSFLIYVTNSIQPDDYKSLVRTGAADWVGWDSALAEIREISRRKRVVQSVVSDGAGAIPHIVATFIGAGGGVGTTTMALETGIWLASQKGANARSVAVVDLEPQDSVICDYVDLAPRVNFVELARDPERLDDYLLNIFTTHHSSGLHIFACEHQRTDSSTIDPVAIFTLLNRLVERYQIVIVDGGSNWTPWLDGVLAQSDKVFLVGRYSVPSVKNMTRRLAAVREMGIAMNKVSVVLNHCAKGLFGGHQRRSSLDSLFAGIESHHVVADTDTAIECVDTGASIVGAAPRSAIAKDIKKIAGSILQLAATSRKS